MNFTGAAASTRAISAMMDTMAPRGPDGAGLWANGATALGHRRLKIIDLSERAQQPMVDADLGLSVAFNGCIYNYKELRAELEGKGYRFFSDGDTEVVIKAWHAWGKDAPKRFHGMFAFAVDERDSGRLALVRDRLGIKPLYYSEQPGKSIRFASTLPALLAAGGVDTSIDPVALHYYMTFHAVVPPPHTIIKGVRKVEPGTVTVFEPDGSRSTSRFWSLSFARTSEEAQRSSAEWKALVHDALRTAVDRRMVADVPVGVLLSGGLDSSLIVGLLAEGGQQHLKTFSIGFELVGGEQGDEFQYSDIIAKHFDTEHHKLFIEFEKLIASLPETIQAMSEPMVSYDNVGFYLLSKEVARHVKVVQSGQGADEVFAGYHWYPPLTDSNDPVGDYAANFFDRDHAEYARIMEPGVVDGDHALDFVRAQFQRARRRRRDRQGAAPRFDHHAGRRSGEARRQHDHGLGPGSARAVPRPRPGRARRQGSGGRKGARRRQGHPQRRRARDYPRRSDRPAEGLFPGSGAEIYRRAGAGLRAPGARCAGRPATWVGQARIYRYPAGESQGAHYPTQGLETVAGGPARALAASASHLVRWI